MLAVFAHRIVGFALGVYLRTILDPEQIGQYAFHFDWVSLRCGLDQNMLVIAGLEWRNPPMFTNTPYFLRIHEINFVIDAMSVYRAIVFGESIKISQIKLDRASIYLEKLSQRSINRATAAAALKRPISVGNTNAEGSAVDNSVHKDTPSELDQQSTPPNSPLKITAPRKQLPVGLLNLWACMGAQDFAQETSYLTKITKNISRALSGTTNMVQLLGTTVSRINVTGTIYKGAQNVTSTIGSAIGKNFLRTFGGGGGKKSSADNNNSAQRDRTRTMSTTDGVPFADSDSEMDMNASTHSSNGRGDSTLTKEEALALLQAEYPDLVLPPLPEEAFDEEDVRHQYELSQHSTPTVSAKTNKTQKTDKADANKGFGIPYRLEIDQLYLHDVQLHAQDFLNAKHSKDKKAGVIKLKSLTMFRNELTAAPDRRLGGKRQGIYLDDVVWRLVNKLLSELLRHNSLAMMVLLSSAAANRTSSAVSSGAGIASYGATTTKKAFTGLGQVFTGSTSNSHSNSKSPVRPRSDTAGSVNNSSSNAVDPALHASDGDNSRPVSLAKPLTASSPLEHPSQANDAHTSQGTTESVAPSPGAASSAANNSAATAQATATAAAQSAFKALNATGADVQKNAMNAFQTILKRTGSTKQP